MINVKQIAKFVVGLGDKVAPTDIEEGMRVGVDRNKYQVGGMLCMAAWHDTCRELWHSCCNFNLNPFDSPSTLFCWPPHGQPILRLLSCLLATPQIQIPLPPKIDPSVTMMTVEEKPDITYSDIGGSKEQIEKMREVVELPMLHPEKFVQLGIDPPKVRGPTPNPPIE